MQTARSILQLESLLFWNRAKDWILAIARGEGRVAGAFLLRRGDRLASPEENRPHSPDRIPQSVDATDLRIQTNYNKRGNFMATKSPHLLGGFIFFSPSFRRPPGDPHHPSYPNPNTSIERSKTSSGSKGFVMYKSAPTSHPFCLSNS